MILPYNTDSAVKFSVMNPDGLSESSQLYPIRSSLSQFGILCDIHYNIILNALSIPAIFTGFPYSSYIHPGECQLSIASTTIMRLILKHSKTMGKSGFYE